MAEQSKPKQPVSQISLFQILLVLEFVFLVLPALLISVGLFGSNSLFIGYLIASVIALVLSIYLLKRYEHILLKLPWVAVIVILILKLIVLEAVLLYFFTPMLDFAGFNLAWAKMCNDVPYFSASGTPDAQAIGQICKNGLFNPAK